MGDLCLASAELCGPVVSGLQRDTANSSPPNTSVMAMLSMPPPSSLLRTQGDMHCLYCNTCEHSLQVTAAGGDAEHHLPLVAVGQGCLEATLLGGGGGGGGGGHHAGI